MRRHSLCVVFAVVAISLFARSAGGVTISLASAEDPSLAGRGLMFFDSSGVPSLRGTYVAVRINNSDGVDYPDVWISLAGFGTGSVARLASSEDGLFHVGRLANGQAATAYFFLEVVGSDNQTTSATVNVFGTRPPATPFASRTVAFRLWDTIWANANKVRSVTFVPAPPAVPQVGADLTIRVSSETGTIGSNGIIAFTPASRASWPADTFELRDVRITLTGGVNGVFEDVLAIVKKNRAKTSYVAEFVFRVTGTTTASVPVRPVAYISSGCGVKHTTIDTPEYLAIPPVVNPLNNLTVAKMATSGPVFAGTRVSYRLRLQNTGTLGVSLDTFVDLLPTTPARPTYVPGSSSYRGAAIADPQINGDQLRWSFNFTVAPSVYADLVYQLDMPYTAGSFVNQAYALLGSTQIDTTTSLTDNAPAVATVVVGMCGDGNTVAGLEQCDDGNTVSGDGCTMTCRIEPDTRVSTGPAVFSNAPTASFTFDDPTGDAVSFECSQVGGAPWSLCPAGTYTWSGALVDGQVHTFFVRGIDAEGNVDGTPASWSWTADFTAPDTHITDGPATPSNDTAPLFYFGSIHSDVAGYSCSENAINWSSCDDGTYRWSGTLLDGQSYTFWVRSTDAAGNTDSTPAGWPWTVDLTSPDTTITTGPSDPSNDPTPSFAFHSLDPDTVRFECSEDVGETWFDCSSGNHTFLAILVDGASYTLLVRAVDGAEQSDLTPAEWTWVADFTPPETVLTDGPAGLSNDTQPVFGFESPSPDTVGFECSEDAGYTWVDCSNGTYQWAGEIVDDGDYALWVRARDAAGNVDQTPAQSIWSTDFTEPETFITSGLPSPSSMLSPSFTFEDPTGDAVTFDCSSTEGSSWEECPGGTFLWLTAIADGETSTFMVRGIDLAGNVDSTPSVWSWLADFTAPETVITEGPENGDNTVFPSFSFNDPTADAVAFECSEDTGLSWVNCPGGEYVWTGYLDDGIAAMFSVRSIDAANNVDQTPAEWMWTPDLSVPDTEITSGPADPSRDSSASFEFVGLGTNVINFECFENAGVGWVDCPSGSYTWLGPLENDMTYSFLVRAVGTSGADPDPAEWSWTVDRTAPDTLITSGPTDPSNDTVPSFLFRSDDLDVVAFECSDTDGSSWTACADGRYVWTPALEDGQSYTFYVRAFDAAGNVDETPAEWSWTADLTAPDTAIETGPGHRSSVALPNFTVSSPSPDTVVIECSEDDGDTWMDCTGGTHGWSSVTESGHVYSLRARAVDGAGNTDPTPAMWAWTADFDAPSTVITDGPADPSNERNVSFAFESEDEDVIAFECSEDEADTWVDCSEETHDWAGTLEDDQTHNFMVRAIDSAGNTEAEPAQWSWTTDFSAPDTLITVAPPEVSTNAHPRFEFVDPTETAVAFECSEDVPRPWTPCDDGFWVWTSAVWDGGTFTFRVRAIDATGNVDQTPASASFRYDITDPDTRILSGPNNLTPEPAPEFTFDDPTGDAVTFECSQELGATWIPCPNGRWTWLGGVITGEHYTFVVRGVDAAGNVDLTPAGRSFRSGSDADGDGWLDGWDNCIGVANPDQANLDGDLFGDACDTDIDGDGLPNEIEDADGDGLVGPGETDPREPDSDDDGLCDGRVDEGLLDSFGDVICEFGEDLDLDGEKDDEETDPTMWDTDSDGLSDGVEVLGDNPTDPLDPDSDDDGLCDGSVGEPVPNDDGPPCEFGEDLDQDGSRDSDETDPNDADTDDGGVDDGTEVLVDYTDPLDPTDDRRPGGDTGGDAGSPEDQQLSGLSNEYHLAGGSCLCTHTNPQPASIFVVFFLFALGCWRRRIGMRASAHKRR